MAEYFNVTTNLGDAEVANAITNNTKIDITHIAFGDGNGSVPTPLKTRTDLVREVHRQPVTKYERHKTNPNWIVIETIIPSNVGGFTVREIGVIGNGKLISHGNHAPFEKVADPSGVSEYRLKFTQNITDGNVVSITLDESLIFATQAWVEENYIKRSEIVDNLTTEDATKPVSAKQAKILQDTKFKSDGPITVHNDFPAWDAKSGIYTKANAAGQQTVIHFLGGGSVPAVQFLVDYSNGGISYRSARDALGFENPFEKLVTEKSGKAVSASAADTADKLKNARSINGVNFDGSKNINLPMLGRSQTYKTTSKVGNTNYTNSGDTPLFEKIIVRGAGQQINIWIGGNRVTGSTEIPLNQIVFIDFIIPPGNAYAVTTNSNQILEWSSLS